ncbi:putative membrane protein [Cardiosporidium cionae]|uniref:ER membrane protein complex subunit 3 n=1 Tax=Cardiosporidium cionae TaxID=476202 RepID=A0ABQ7JEQ2_9APIC|nr:putative membrane protein [Cardiosporidium cionae]|eukprot:KAF8822453.1 putative membrane protein [Cardiosporidium cionae]
MKEISLDPSICNSATIPIFLVTLFVCAIRQNIAVASQLAPKKKVLMLDQKISNVISRCQHFRWRAFLLPKESFFARYDFFCNKDNGILLSAPPQPNPWDMLFSQDSVHTAGLLKMQIAFLVLQGGLGFFVNLLFSGFLVAKSPFPLPFRFKGMLQRGVDVPLLDVAYVSSLSWYFLVMLGSGGLVMILNGLLNLANQEKLQQQSSIMEATGVFAGGGIVSQVGGAPKAETQYKEQQDGLSMLKHEFYLENVEEFLLQQWNKENVASEIAF